MTHPAEPAGADAPPMILDIDLSALARNWQAADAASGRAQTAAVIKADGYGVGIANAARAFAEGGCTTFFVATVAEGRAARAAVAEADIYVLNGVMPGEAPAAAQARLRPVLNSAAAVAAWARVCAEAGARLPAALHLDTGLNRLGLSADELAAVTAHPDWAGAFELTLVMSHLACADEPDHPLNARQRASFEEMRRQLPDAPASLANSAGIFLGPDYHFDLTRPGICLYGASPFAGRPAPFEVAVTARARILQLREVGAGESIGYGATFSPGRPTRLAIVAGGYADGIFRALGNRGTAAITGVRVPYAGRVSMDLTALDVTALPRDAAQPGGWAEIFGPTVPVDEIAAAAGTIGYEVLTSTGSRYLRRTFR